ncbi:MAG TPA: response regulator [Verrucomicrobiae bacterium]|nr:response regulator [Verrucomicrobiae bacterium]
MSKSKVFIVDDDVTASRLLAVGLEKTGLFEVKVENVATRALGSARQFRPDVIFMDVCMPGADGTDVAFQIQNDPVLGATPLIFLTSLISGQEANSQMERGGREFLPKPATLAKIIACIQRHLPGRTESAGTATSAT